MSLQFVFGPSGSGKSRKLHEDITAWAEREPERTFLFLVPDQFTMQTQLDLVKASSKKGIMNIDVLSFSRLAHRVFEETGFDKKPVLDDTGKSLVLRRVAEQNRDALSVIGKNISQLGYIHEIKSALSEFMQYGLSPKDVEGLAAYAKNRGMLSGKLRDLQLLYDTFLSTISEQYTTSEETLELLTRAVEVSAIVKGSVVILDGFTGFTPIQNRLIQRLMEVTDLVIVSITIDMLEDPFHMTGEQELFYLSKKTVHDLCRLAEESSVPRAEDIRLQEPVYRFLKEPALAHLERQLFRYPVKPFCAEDAEMTGQQAISITEALSPAEEAKNACYAIRELVRSEGYRYRDIAVVVGNMETYGDYLEREANTYEIPVFMDRTRGLLLNPFIEFIRSAYQILQSGFSYESVFHYIRCGIADFTMQEADELENYVLSLGLKGRKRYSEAFVRRGKTISEKEQALSLENLNQTREKLMQQLAPLLEKQETADGYVRALYAFIMNAHAAEKLAGYEQQFRERGEADKALEYAQVYRVVMELLEQIDSLLPDEKMTVKEFADILDAGFAEITIGTIPGSVDRVMVGDIERTRLSQVKALFFLGVNDGNIPRSGKNGGIISDMDREFLQESDYELAPTPRQQMFIQRLYLYMNLTKPSQRLYLSYARIGNDGKSIRASYLIELIRKLFPAIKGTTDDEEKPLIDRISGTSDGLSVLAKELLHYRDGHTERKEALAALLARYEKEPLYRKITEKMTEAAFESYLAVPLTQEIARAVYGMMLENSVSRLERYAACAYAHFLQYGLQLKEREEYSFEAADLGTVYHAVLERFAGKLAECGKTWFDFTKEEGDALLQEAMQECTASYGETILYSNARYEYMTERMYRILQRTVQTLQAQLRGGAFMPKHFEMSFSQITDLKSVNLSLSDEETMKLRGRIDRIDTCEDEDHVYVKVIDYKSGKKDFDLAAVYSGLQLQLVVYMNVATEAERKKHPDKEIVPAALLYYHVADPLLTEEKELSYEELADRRLKDLRLTGIVRGDEQVISLLDRTFTDKSLLIPVDKNKDGSYAASSGIISPDDYETISNFVTEKVKGLGREILSGNIAINPCEQGQGSSCTYCAYKSVCRFDKKQDGFALRKLPKGKKEEILLKMQEKLTQERVT